MHNVSAFPSRSLQFSLSACSVSTKYWQITHAQGVAPGIASSGISLPALLLATQWFSSKRGLATGIVAAGSSLGGVYPSMVPRLISSNGFPTTVRWIALMQSILLIIANMLVSTSPEPKGLQKKESAGLHAFKSWHWIAFVLGCFFVMWAYSHH